MPVLKAKIGGVWTDLTFLTPPEVAIGNTTPTGNQVLWIDTTTAPPTTKAFVGGTWVVVGAVAPDEVWIGTDDPNNPQVELWYDTDASPSVLPGVGLPAGGAINQFLTKKSANNYDTQWITPAKNPQVFYTSLLSNTPVAPNVNATLLTLNVPITPAGTILIASFQAVYLAPGTAGVFDLVHNFGPQGVVDQRSDSGGQSRVANWTGVGLSSGAAITCTMAAYTWGNQQINFYNTTTNIMVMAVAP
jgi:hypothetical protein